MCALRPICDGVELLHLAEDPEAGDLWLAPNEYCKARLEEVSVDEVGAEIAEGRAAA